MELILSGNNIMTPDGKLKLKKLGYTINDRYEGDVQRERFVLVPDGTDEFALMDKLSDQLDTGDDYELAHDFCYLEDVNVIVPRFTEVEARKAELSEAMRTAQEQRRCHENQASGAWSIDAKSFCETYKLNYDSALKAQHKANTRIIEAEVATRQASIEQQVGKMTYTQCDTLRKHVEKMYESDIDVEFWNDITCQIASELDKEK